MQCGPSGSNSGENRYADDICDNGTTQYTNADVTSIMNAEEMLRQVPAANDTSMVQD